MKFIYQGRTKEGKIETGTVEASSKEAAALLLQKYNIFVTSLKEQRSGALFMREISFLSKVSKKDLAIFSRQLSLMLQARVPVIQALRSLALQIKKADFKEKILKIAQLVEEGNSLSEAFENYPEVFDVFYVSVIKRGEASGKISDALFDLSNHLEREYDISAQIKSAFIYPIFVLVVLAIVILIVMFFVMPRLVDLLQQASTTPPLFTRLMIGFYSFLRVYGVITFLILFFLISSIIYYFTTKQGKEKWDKIILKTPFLKELIKKIFLIRFAENLSTLIEAGLSVNNALKITKETITNIVYKQILKDTEEGVSGGERISAVLVKYPELVPPFVVQMIQVGEETGKLDKNLREVSNFYQKEVTRAVNNIVTLLEPILIIFLGIIVALLAISIIQPLYETLGTI